MAGESVIKIHFPDRIGQNERHPLWIKLFQNIFGGIFREIHPIPIIKDRIVYGTLALDKSFERCPVLLQFAVFPCVSDRVWVNRGFIHVDSSISL